MDETDLALIERLSTFEITLLTPDERREGELDQRHPVHDTVLRPLLSMADGCWVYGMDKSGPLWEIAEAILRPDKGKFRIDLSEDPIRGREGLWNATGGMRGSIAISIPVDRFEGGMVFPHCLRASATTNPGAAHSSGAIAFAKKRAAEGAHVVVCLPRNNGIEWADVFAPKPLLLSLYAQASSAAQPSRA